jgi:Domain of unknown function (DUF4157)
LGSRRRYEPDSEEARRVLLGAQPEKAERGGDAGLGARILELQSTVGNAAVTRLLEGGALLPRETAAVMGTQFSADFSGVRVHTDLSADALSRSLDARALTIGSDIFFSNGSYRPDQPQGRELLAHELTHVVQQAQGAPGGEVRVSRPDEPAEVQAREIGRSAAGWASSRGTGVDPARPLVGAAGTGTIHRDAAGTASGMSDQQRAKLIAAALDQATVSGGKAEDRAAIAKDLTDSDTDAETWFADIVPGTFLGLPIGKSGGKVAGVHRELLDVLQTAEQELLSRHPGLSPKQVAAALGVYAIVGLRPPKKATGGEHPSMHCFGMAVDINYRGNPFVGMKSTHAVVGVTERATLLLTGNAVSVRKAPHRLRDSESDDSDAARQARAVRAGKMWDRLHSASDAVRAYLNLTDADLVALVEADGHGHDLGWWRDRLAEDKELHDDGEFGNHSDPAKAGFMDLSRELVEVLVGAGLSWGGCYETGKDIMHFDLRTGTIQGRAVL